MLQTGLLRDNASEQADDSLDLKTLLRVLLKYKWVLLVAALLGLVVAVVKTLTSTPLYQAAVTLQIERPGGRIVSFKDSEGGQDYEDYMALPTQIELLRSRALAERVVDELNLDPARGQGPQAGVLGGRAGALGHGLGCCGGAGGLGRRQRRGARRPGGRCWAT